MSSRHETSVKEIAGFGGGYPRMTRALVLDEVHLNKSRVTYCLNLTRRSFNLVSFSRRGILRMIAHSEILAIVVFTKPFTLLLDMSWRVFGLKNMSVKHRNTPITMGSPKTYAIRTNKLIN